MHGPDGASWVLGAEMPLVLIVDRYVLPGDPSLRAAMPSRLRRNGWIPCVILLFGVRSAGLRLGDGAARSVTMPSASEIRTPPG